MDYALWVQMFGPDADTAPRPQTDAPPFDELFSYRVAGHAADARIRSVERDELTRAICDDDPQPITAESAPASTFDAFVKSLSGSIDATIDDVLSGGNHFQKMGQRADAIMRKAASCPCSCLLCRYGDCADCDAAEKCAHWRAEHAEGIKNKRAYDKHLGRALGLLEPLRKYCARRGWLNENLEADIGYAAHEIASGMLGVTVA